jgi:indole-3-glycerol phosphate synthase
MILDKIIQNSRRELEARKRIIPLEKMRQLADEQNSPLDMVSALRGDCIKLIAEVKKASPSRGLICSDFNPVDIAKIYSSNGAAAISILTETEYFQGSLEYLRQIDSALGNIRPPLLRKDFIFDSYQVYESKAYGADALLLIVAILTCEQLGELLRLSHQLGLSSLVETHNENELEIALKSGARIIGINNRDLNTFNVDIAITKRLRPLIPADRVVVSESGIKTRSDIEKMKVWGVNAVLVGESLMASSDIAAKMKELL